MRQTLSKSIISNYILEDDVYYRTKIAVSGRSCPMWTVVSYMIIEVTFEPRLEEVEGAGQGGIWRESVLSRSSCCARRSLKNTPDVFQKHHIV